MSAEPASLNSWQGQAANDPSPLDGDSSAFLVSFLVHLCVLIVLGLAPVVMQKEEVRVALGQFTTEETVEVVLPAEFNFSELPAEEIRANSVQGTLVALSAAPVVSEMAAVPSYLDMIRPVENAKIEINNFSETPTGLHYAENLAVKGAAGEGPPAQSGRSTGSRTKFCYRWKSGRRSSCGCSIRRKA